MVKIFLDLGTNYGQGLTEFNDKFDFFNKKDWVIYCFEPNSSIDIENLFPNVNNINYVKKAVWIENSEITFRKQGLSSNNYTGLGSKIETVAKVYHPKNVDYKLEVVNAIDFADFLEKIVKKHQNPDIYVKMDIEGAEFDVIDHLIETNTISYIKELYCETHERFNYPAEKHHELQVIKEMEEIRNNLKNKVEINGIKFHFWN